MTTMRSPILLASLVAVLSGCSTISGFYRNPTPLPAPRIQVRTTEFDRQIGCVRQLLAQQQKRALFAVERVTDQTTSQLYHGVAPKFSRDVTEEVLHRLGQAVAWSHDDGRISAAGVKNFLQLRGGIAALDLTTNGTKNRQEFGWSPGKGRGAVDIEWLNAHEVAAGQGSVVLTLWNVQSNPVQSVRQIAAVRVMFNFAREEHTTGFSGGLVFYGLRAGTQQARVHINGIHEAALQAHEVATTLLVAEAFRIDPKGCFGWR